MKWLFHFKKGTKKNLNTCFKDTLDSARLVGRTAPHWLSVGSTLGEIDYYWMVQVQIGFFRGLFPSSTRRLGIIFWKVKPPATLRFWVMVYHVSPQSENLPWQRVHQGVSTVSFRFSGSWDQQPLHDGFFVIGPSAPVRISTQVLRRLRFCTWSTLRGLASKHLCIYPLVI